MFYPDAAGWSVVPCWLHHPQTCFLCWQTAGGPVRVQWRLSDKPKPVFQMISWPQTLEPHVCRHCPVILGFYGTGMMVEHLKHEGTSHSSSDLLKIFVKIGASWSAHVLRQSGDILSVPGAFRLLFSLKTWRTSSSLIFSAGVGERGLLDVLMVVWRDVHGGCGVFFWT